MLKPILSLRTAHLFDKNKKLIKMINAFKINIETPQKSLYDCQEV